MVLYFESTQGTAEAGQVLAGWEQVHGVPSDQTPPVTSSTHAFSDWDTYNTVAYYHGALFLHALRRQMGDERF